MEESHSSQLNEEFAELGIIEPNFPPSLKFLMNHITRIVTTQLAGDNYPLWRSQVLKLMRANDYEGFLNGSKTRPPQFIQIANEQTQLNPTYRAWILLDQNLSSALCSTITTLILPYVINLDSTHAIWTTIEKRLQATNRSRILQLKNELHTISMQNQSLTQYLTHIKTIVDNLTAARAPIDSEDIIWYTLNWLPPQYQGFKTIIRNMLTDRHSNQRHIGVLFGLGCNQPP